MNEIIAALLTLLLTAITGYVYMRVLRSKKPESLEGESKDSEASTLDDKKILESVRDVVSKTEDALAKEKELEAYVSDEKESLESVHEVVAVVASVSVESTKYEPLVRYEVVNNPMKPYITRDEPFGPIDSTDIDLRDINALEKLFEQHNNIYKSLRHRPSIIMGRKGSGKTSYLRTVFFDKKYDYYTEIRTAHVLSHISKVIQRITGKAVFPETLAELWEMILWICVLSEIRKKDQLLSQDKLSLVNNYLDMVGIRDTSTVDDVLRKLASIFDQVMEENPDEGITEILRRFDRVTFDNTVMAVVDSLKAAEKSFVILMDSLDDFQLDIESVSNSMMGLLKFVGSMNKPRDVVDIRFCLPTELYRRIIKISSNPNKDFRRSLKLQWTASELILIAAQRLKIYLELYYPKFWKSVPTLDLTKRSDALKLFHTVLPGTLTNPYGFQEETITYILRHTQLLPRHFLMLLNSIFRSPVGIQSLNPFPISEARILNGIRQVEERIVTEIFVAFKLIHPTAEAVCKRCIPELGHKFSMGELHRVYTRKGKAVFEGENLFEFQRMLLEIGAMGRVIPSKTTDIYIQGNFEYTVEHEIAVSQDDELCIHPLFSDIFHSSGEQDRPVYPYGSYFGDENYEL